MMQQMFDNPFVQVFDIFTSFLLFCDKRCLYLKRHFTNACMAEVPQGLKFLF